jgi:rod shape-determining protein MreC
MATRRSFGRGRNNNGPVFAVAILTALISIALTLVVVDRRQGGEGAVSGMLADGAAAIGGVVSAPFRWAGAALDQATGLVGGASELQRTKAENTELKQWRDAARAMAERLDRYEALLKMPAEPFEKGISARMVAESAGPFSRAGLVNVGSAQGVKADWLVVSENGLVGRVVSVGAASSRVLLLTDSDSRVPVMGEVTRARAILAGDRSAAPRIQHLNDPARITEGERLLTSGDDGVFPRGLTIGLAGKGPDGLWRARLASDRTPIDFVRLVPPSSFPPPATATTPGALPGAVEGIVPVPALGVAGNAAAARPARPAAAPVPRQTAPQSRILTGEPAAESPDETPPPSTEPAPAAASPAAAPATPPASGGNGTQ